MNISLFSTARALLAVVALAISTVAGAQWHHSARAPAAGKALAAESLKLLPGFASKAVVTLGEVDAATIDAIRLANSRQETKRLQVGVGRQVPREPATTAAALRWEAVPGGAAAQWVVTSSGARAVRVAMEVASLPLGTEIRVAGSGGAGTVYGPFTAGDMVARDGPWWSPVLEGDSAIVEVFHPLGARSGLSLAIAQVSHLFASPRDADVDAQAKIGESQFCERDLICLSASNAALASVGDAVARMSFVQSGSSFLCTGTLLNPTDNSFVPYFYSAAHCMDSQAVASTLTTHWFYDRTGCGSGGVSPRYVQVSGGATLLYADESSDVLFLRLNQSPPAGAVYAGWDAATLGTGVALTGVHHPAGDVKKVSLGTGGGFQSNPPDGPSGSFIVSRWNSIATGVTEGGSSGSGIFTSTGADYRLRGGLWGGPSSCSTTSDRLYDYYSRFDQAYPKLSQYLNPSTGCAYTLSPTSASVAAGASTGSFTVSTSAGCGWTASSNASWITITGGASGVGTGAVSYAVAANPAAARTGTVTAGGQTFTVSQQAGQSTVTSIIANGGFESGGTSWTQQSANGQAIIRTDGGAARTGTYGAWLGGYGLPATDLLHQEIAIPANASQVSLRFWYRISTEETDPVAYDFLVVRLQDPATGATVATLASYSNVNATSAWVQSPVLDLAAYRGRTLRLSFTATADDSLATSFFIDDITLTATIPAATTANYTGLWYNAPAESESGWGINFTHQGDIVFATLFTYDASGAPLWLVMPAGQKQADGVTFSGELGRTTGPAFNAVPFTWNPASNYAVVGTMSVTFNGDETASLVYTYAGATVRKTIIKQRYGTRVANCVPASASRDALTNYQDLWWNSPQDSEPGWGVNVTHQDNILFATLFTYDASGRDLWLVMSRGERQADGSYLGTLYRTSGPPFNANPFTPINAGNLTIVGTMRFAFTSGTAGTLTYTYNGLPVTKAITRQVFSSPVPACS